MSRSQITWVVEAERRPHITPPGEPLEGGGFVLVDPTGPLLLVHGVNAPTLTPTQEARILAMVAAKVSWQRALGLSSVPLPPSVADKVSTAQALKALGLARLGEYARFLTNVRPAHNVLHVAHALAIFCNVPPRPVAGMVDEPREPRKPVLGGTPYVIAEATPRNMVPRRRWIVPKDEVEALNFQFMWIPGFRATMERADPVVDRLVLSGFGGRAPGAPDRASYDEAQHMRTHMALALCGMVLSDAQFGEPRDEDLETWFDSAAHFVNERTPNM
jgi:hypothetical protein